MYSKLAGLFFWASFCLLCRPALAQDRPDLGSYRDKLDLLLPQPYSLRPFIQPGTETVVLDGTRLDSTRYRIDYRHGKLWIDGLHPDPRRSLVVTYRTWGYVFQDAYRRRSVLAAPGEDSTEVAIVENIIPPENQEPAWTGAGLRRSGSISRGILLGNNRDATVESGLRMHVEGEVAEGVRVQAVLTDENTPILPEGTTQRLEEFDRVFIQIDASPGTAQLGDVDLRFDAGELSRFSRKLQGIHVYGSQPGQPGSVFAGSKTHLTGATTRGIFNTQDLAILDGVQGPYRLEGKSNERFILIIPGSETVFVDGQRMERGAAQDYIIDYATGELTFTARRLITRENRVSVEFQYTTTEFTRTLLGLQSDVALWSRPDGTGRGRLGVTYLREADSRSFNEAFGLTAAEDSLLALIGDSLVTRTAVTLVPFDPEAPFVQYVQRDTTLLDGTQETYYTVVTRTPAEGEPVYRIRFSRVGEAKGRYVREGQSVNGLLYVYKGPGRGDYDAIQPLPKPRAQQLFDLRGGFEPVAGLEFFGEWARSINDENRLSPRDSEDDLGHAYLGGLRLKPTTLHWQGQPLGKVSAHLNHRITDQHFAAFERTRSVEFARRWNLDNRTTAQGGSIVQTDRERVDEGSVAFDFFKKSQLRLEAGRMFLGTFFEGTRQAVFAETQEGGWPRLTLRHEDIRSTNDLLQENGSWLRSLLRAEKPLLKNRITPFFEIERENRRQRVGETDSLASPSLAFLALRPGVSWQFERAQVGGSLEVRQEDQWSNGSLKDAGKTWTLQSTFALDPSAILHTDGNIGYRKRDVHPFFEQNHQQKDQESLVLQWNGRFLPLERAVNLTWFYEALTERTPIQQEIYVRTGAEFGEYVWEDANGDGIPQVDEFIPERTQDEGTYVRSFLPSDSLASIISVQTRLNLQFDPSRMIKKARSPLQKALSNVTTRTTFHVQEKSRTPDLAQIYLLNLHRFRDPVHTLRGSLRISQDVSFFRNHPRYGLDLLFNQIRSLGKLAAGEERRFLNQWRGEATWRPVTRWGLKLISSWEKDRTDSEAFASRRYTIRSVSLEPEVSFSPIRTLQLASGFSLVQKEDAVGDRKATVWKVPFSSRYTLGHRLNLSTRLEAAHVRLDGEATGLANFALTDGRGEGTSYLWTVTGWYQVSRLLRATLSYNGRAPETGPILHTVRFQLSAIF